MRRTLIVYCGLLLCFWGLILRLGSLAVGQNTTLSQAAARQSTYTLEVASTRGGFYDRALRPLTNAPDGWITAVAPGEESALPLLEALPKEKRPAALSRLREGKPFALSSETPLGEVFEGAPLGSGTLLSFPAYRRYGQAQPAAQLLGTLDAASGRGASGLEAAYDPLLSGYGGKLRVRWQLDGGGRPFPDSVPTVDAADYGGAGGLVLTLDARVQHCAEQAAEELERGAVVVLDVESGEALAMVSRPALRHGELAQALSDPGAPFLDRCLAAYPVGSSFKLAVAAAALEAGIPSDTRYECAGAVSVSGRRFGCHYAAGHGWPELTAAIEHSCNPYFIRLGASVGGEALLQTARMLGFGQAALLGNGFASAAGTLPSPAELASPAGLANFSFGQGSLTATPLQVAGMVAVIANGGVYHPPRVVLGETADGKTLLREYAPFSGTRALSETTAAALRERMTAVVETGSGQEARPFTGGAGGKTASAQTGRFDAEGREVVHAWFTGYFPAESPRYAIAVLAEGAESGARVAAPIFAELTDALARLMIQEAMGGSGIPSKSLGRR